MKLDARRVDSFLRDPGTAQVALLYGDDLGLIRERSNRLVKAVAGATADPFRVSDLDSDMSARLAMELAAPPLTGGRRAVRVRDVRDSLTSAVQAVIETGSAGFLVLEAPGLAARSKLRALVEQAPTAAAIACYPPAASELMISIRRVMEAEGISLDPDALQWLQGHLGADGGVTRSELEKLALYAGPHGHMDLAGAQSCVGELARLSTEDAIFAATAGDLAETDRSLDVALGEGAASVGVLRAALLHLQRLAQAKSTTDRNGSGGDRETTPRASRFFRREPAFRKAVGLWTVMELESACMRMNAAERACKRTGARAETICRSAILGVAQRAAAAARR